MNDDVRPIIIKRVKKVAGGHHGGAWKIAYADFVTAMMAFFLLMWLLGSTASGDLKGIAEFFQNPLKIAAQGGSGTGDSSSVLKGGGKDLTRSAGQVKAGDIEAKSKQLTVKETNAESARKVFEQQERLMLGELKESIEKLIESNPALKQFKSQLLLDITSEGLRIQIVDEQNRPMFDTSSAEVKPYTKVILREIGKVLNAVPSRISLAGHTDAAQFGGGEKGFSNWELSANRANASRRELIAGGMDEHKVLRVVGLASTVLLDKNDPLSSVNRRISIVVLNKRTEESLLLEDGRVDAVEVGSQGVEAEALSSPTTAAGK
ncbi:MAG TPA: flagellar motor protein MotB [Accumulibacter sp.]|uniref:flagellar motor protein MotB n=2 Tax=Accumulibacter sp. TaxID=2053492 RepID=UPI002C04ECC2|nr:flagellar motor protein MotB [Accumulibacter sp.]HMX69106.1 flagellar motor protein MotB [Accumulibacter sp.]HNB68453.1 flagellar motor protein MotB [Accumulibacter sp.]HNI51786.1 flagellar motor protein MotB [Accumulibacter sp.]